MHYLVIENFLLARASIGLFLAKDHGHSSEKFRSSDISNPNYNYWINCQNVNILSTIRLGPEGENLFTRNQIYSSNELTCEFTIQQ